jgi:hypothetical protein
MRDVSFSENLKAKLNESIMSLFKAPKAPEDTYKAGV